MSYETRAYDNDHGDPVIVLVAAGTHDVSRLVNLLAGSRMALVEQVAVAQRLLRQVKRHNGGRAALALLKLHGGPDFTAADGPTVEAMQPVLDFVRDVAAGKVPGTGDYVDDWKHYDATVRRAREVLAAVQGGAP